MNIYLFTEKNELIKSTFQPVEHIDPMTPYFPENAVIADSELPQLAPNQAYLVSGERNADGHYTVSANVAIVGDFRDNIAYNKQTQARAAITEIGEIDDALTLLEPASSYHVFTDGDWHINAEGSEQQLADARAEKLTKLNTLAESTVEALANISKTPAFERATWTIQATEATAWYADNTTPTPNLDKIAESRGVPADVLRQKAYEKAMAYEALTAVIAGQRQRFEDLIDAAGTVEELNAMTFEFTVG